MNASGSRSFETPGAYRRLTNFAEEKKGFRRRGIGTLLLQCLLQWGHDNGAEHAYLAVQASNTAGVRLSEKLGFIEQHRRIYARLRG